MKIFGKYTAWLRDDVVYDVNEVNKLIAPVKVFTMVWTLQNTGTCTWTSGYQMHFDLGEPITQAESFPIMPAGTLIPPGGGQSTCASRCPHRKRREPMKPCFV